MPQLPMINARSSPGVLTLPSPSPQSFGAQAGQGLSEFGQAIQQVGQKIQDSEDRIALAQMAGEYDEQLDAAKQAIAATPDITQHRQAFQAAHTSIQSSLLAQYPQVSRAVHTAFQAHTAQALPRHAIDLAHHGQVIRTQRARADFLTTEEKLVQRAALAPTPDDAAPHLELLSDLRRSMVNAGMLGPLEAQKSQESAQHTFWTLRAQHDPNGLLDLAEESAGEGGQIAGMDHSKLHVYVNLAYDTLNAQQRRANQALAAQEKEVKAAQQATAANLTADVLEGRSVVEQLPSLLRGRQLDDTDARTLRDLEKKLRDEPNLANYQRGLAPQIEAELSKIKYDNRPMPDGLDQGLISNFMEGDITKEEFGHLMATYRSVLDHKMSAGKERGNQDIAHAHTNLVQRLRTTGPSDKFDALSEQTIAEAGQFFYRRMNQDPNADPWKVMQDAETIFRPAIEKRLGLNKTDKAILDDARMEGMLKSKAISPAAHKAYRDKSQSDRGWNAVQDAIKALPPPPEPGFFERLFKRNAPERKQGVMQGE